MSFNSNYHCSTIACSNQCCDAQGLCPLTSVNCFYPYDSYYCLNPCTNTFIYSSTPCATTTCQTISQLGGSLIGIIIGSAVLCVIISCIVCYCCNKYSAKVSPDDLQSNQENNHSVAAINNNRNNDTIQTFASTFKDEFEVGYGKPIPRWKRTMQPSFH